MSEFAMMAGQEDINDMYAMVWKKHVPIVKEPVDVSKLKTPKHERLKDLFATSTNDEWQLHLNKIADVDPSEATAYNVGYGVVETTEKGKKKAADKAREWNEKYKQGAVGGSKRAYHIDFTKQKQERDSKFKEAVAKTPKMDKFFHYKQN